jgi:hypothetical protein
VVKRSGSVRISERPDGLANGHSRRASRPQGGKAQWQRLASTENEHLAYSRLDMTDTVTSSNLQIAQLLEVVGGQKLLNICAHTALNCEFVSIFICIAI